MSKDHEAELQSGRVYMKGTRLISRPGDRAAMEAQHDVQRGGRGDQRIRNSGVHEVSTMRRHWAGVPRYAVICIVLLITTISAPYCYSSNLVFIRSAGDSPADESQFGVAARFYGLDLTVVTINAVDDAHTLEAIRAKSTLGVAIEADVLSFVNQQTLLQALHRASGNNVPLLIVGVTPKTNVEVIRGWSGDAATGVSSLAGNAHLNYVVGQAPGVTHALSGIEMPFPSDMADYFTLSGKSQVQDVLSVRSGSAVAPILIGTTLKDQHVFLLGSSVASGNVDAEDMVHAFAAVAPAMIFVRYSAGSHGWHFPSHYANFTIDDPWLREPYGNLNYENLLAEMGKHNFHTTIAFIPWNYDRSEASVVSLFRAHPDRFSICVHGDNHDHKEFTDFRAKPFNVQVADLAQALARMNEFHRLTGIPYDRVFVFPHSIGEKAILGQLKVDNFLATVNAGSVPIGAAAPKGLLYDLRPASISFENFPSLMRYSAEMAEPRTFIAVNDFLGNPLLFYDHQSLFVKGIGAFDRVADTVNALEPTTQWRSLGDIAAHLYLLRSSDDGGYDVFTFSSSVRLKNTSTTAEVYHIVKREPDASMIQSVTVDGVPVRFTIEKGLLHCRMTIRAGQARKLLITYKNDLDLASIDIRRKSLRVYLLREASDFRDIWLSRSSLGQAAIAYYYGRNESPTWVLAFFGLIFLFAAVAAWAVFASFKRRRLASTVKKTL
ncbi:MAG TPA: hypothetical protein VME86_05940 [Acidobacteriaceae bacterium]|nr:hypothetical protein [Acidobacteriaceae bacterium]